MEVRHLKKSFGDKILFEDLNFSFPSSGTFRIAGPSGLGKTTFLRMIAGLEKPDNGEVEGAGRISMVFQEDRLLENESALYNAAVAGSAEKAEEILKKLGLGDDLDTKAKELSGGMARRVAAARALAREADTYIFDEPLTGLDGENAERTAEVIEEYTEGKLLIVVTHDNNYLKNAETIELK